MQPVMNRSQQDGSDVWTTTRASEWYRAQPWLVGCNFVPSTASNQLEMWQADTFDIDTIESELEYASDLGFNTVRVFLHDLLWSTDAAGLQARLDRFLNVSSRFAIRPMIVLFDGVWGNRAFPGAQREPVPGIHNSTWVQSPPPKVVVDPAEWTRFEPYVQGVLARFGEDDRILMWDLYNEPGNEGLMGNVLPFLEEVFRWAREINPSQPITAGVWNWDDGFNDLNRFQMAHSDIITFHTYEDSESLLRRIEAFAEHDRPLICTEYLARTMGSRFETHLPIFKDQAVGCFNWGLVAGRSQTMYSWDSERGATEPAVWFHDIFRRDGTPFDPAEVSLIRELTGTTVFGRPRSGDPRD